MDEPLNTAPAASLKPWSRRLRLGLRLVRRAVLGLIGLATAAVLLLVLMLALPSGRLLILRAVLEAAGRSLPGSLSVGTAVWPKLSELSLEHVLWSDGSDTLAAVQTLRLHIAMPDLWRRDLAIDLAAAAGVTIDLPALKARLTATASSEAGARAAPASRPWFPRPGALPALPSLGLGQLTLAHVVFKTTPAHTVCLDSLDCALELRRGHKPQLAATIQVRPLSTLGISWRLRGEAVNDTLALALAPLHLAAPPRLPVARDLPLAGRLRLPLAVVDSLLSGRLVWPSLWLERLQIAGDVGSWRLDADLAGRTTGRIVLHGVLPEAPLALLAGLIAQSEDIALSADDLQTLARHWSAHSPPQVDLTLNFTPPPVSAPLSTTRLQANGQLRLPAPAALAPLLPPELMVEDLGPLEVDCEALYDGGTAPAAIQFGLRLDRTAWLEEAHLFLSGNLAAIDSASLAIRAPGLQLSATGAADRSRVRLQAALDLPDATLLRRWRDPALADLALTAAATLAAAGPWSQPRAQLDAAISAAAPGFTLPQAVLTAMIGADTVHVHASLPSGLRHPALDLNGLDCVFAGTAEDPRRRLQGRLALSAEAQPATIDLRGRLDLRDLSTAPAVYFTGERLHLALDRRTLGSTEPWQANFTAADTSVKVSGLRLAGSLGHLDLGGSLGPDSLAVDLDLDLRLPLAALGPLLPVADRAPLSTGALTVRGRLAGRGVSAAPWAAGDFEIAVVDQPDLGGFGADLAFSLAGRGLPPPPLDFGRLGWQAARTRLNCVVKDQDTALAEFSVRIPWPLAAAAPDSIDLRLDAPRLELARLTPLLPAGHTAAGHMAIRVRAQGLMPAELPALIEHGALDPARDFDLEVSGTIHLAEVALQLADSTRITCDGEVALAGTTSHPRAEVDFSLAGDLGRLDLRAEASRDSLTAQGDLDLRLASEILRPYLPLAQQTLLPRGTVAVSGRIEAAGPVAAPWASGALQLAVIDQPELAALTTALELRLGGRGRLPSPLFDSDARWRQESLSLDLSLLDTGIELLRLSVLAPLPHLAAAADSVDVRLQAPALDLSRLVPLLPAGTNLNGLFAAATRLHGVLHLAERDPELDLDGWMQIANLRLQLPEGSRLALSGRLDLAGTSLAPRVRGGLEVAGGLIRLPDPPPSLLPVAGEALLWQAAAAAMPTAMPEPDSPAASAPPAPTAADTAVARTALPRILPDLVFTLTSPGDLWLRGQGLDVELAGDLSLLVRGDRIAVEGELQAVQGTMRQIGHLFRLERGRVIFDGSETELNPELDLALGVRIGQYRLGILLGGTALVPTLRFTSDPELSEGDILATLLFGKPLDELDEGQTGLLASRAAQIAAAYGTTRLQENLARQLGIDVVSISPREDDEQTTVLAVGKYLSPRVMVRYEQLLRQSSAFFVHLDYAFAGAFRLHTQISQGEESGVQLKWQRDW